MKPSTSKRGTHKMHQFLIHFPFKYSSSSAKYSQIQSAHRCVSNVVPFSNHSKTEESHERVWTCQTFDKSAAQAPSFVHQWHTRAAVQRPFERDSFMNLCFVKHGNSPRARRFFIQDETPFFRVAMSRVSSHSNTQNVASVVKHVLPNFVVGLS